MIKQKQHPAPLGSKKKLRILVVDDEHAIASTLSTILELQGYEAITAHSGEEAIEVACSFQPHFILSDVVMGAMSGPEAAMQILGALPKCKVLFISGNAAYRGFLGDATDKGFDFEVLPKPIHPIELLAKISQVLSGQAAS